jgi:FixJ family two-component response regulator
MKKSYLIYIIDDDLVFSKSISYKLSKNLGTDIKIKVFASFDDFMLNIGHKPDIVILDYYLKSSNSIDGLILLQKIKQVLKDTEVVVLAGESSIALAMETIKNGAYDFIRKNDSVFQRIKYTIDFILDRLKEQSHKAERNVNG